MFSLKYWTHVLFEMEVICMIPLLSSHGVLWEQGVADALETEPAIASAVLGKALQASRAAEAARKARHPPLAVAAFCAREVSGQADATGAWQECAGQVGQISHVHNRPQEY